MSFDKITGLVIMGVMMIVIVMVVVIPITQSDSYQSIDSNTPSGYADDVISGTYAPTSTGFSVGGTAVAEAGDKSWIILSDTLSIYRWSSTEFRVWDYATDTTVNLASIVIDADAGTWSGTYSGTAYSGNIGDNAVMRSASGDMGLYTTGQFYVNKDAEIRTSFITASFTIGTTVYTYAEVAVSGTPNNLTVDGIAVLVAGEGTSHLDPSDATVSITSGLTVPNSLVYSVTSPTFEVVIDIDGTEVTKQVTSADIVGPLTYSNITDEDGAMKSLIDIVPLLMIIGVFSVLVVGLVFRK